MLIAMNAGIYKKGTTASSFSGTLSSTGAASTITGTTRTYTLGAGNSGNVTFSSVSVGGTAFQYSKNGGSYVGGDISEGLTITLANSDTLAIRGTGMTPIGTANSCNVVDTDTGTVLENLSVTRV